VEPIQRPPIAVWNPARDVWEIPETADLFCEHSDVYSVTFPTSGMTVSGVAYELPTSVPRMDDSGWESSPLLKTPNAADHKHPQGRAWRFHDESPTKRFDLADQLAALSCLPPP
jgi:hypothetical protein